MKLDGLGDGVHGVRNLKYRPDEAREARGKGEIVVLMSDNA